MALFRFLHRPKPKQYNYIPKYYDAQKEDLHNRLAQIDDENKGDAQLMKARISRGFKQRFRQDKAFRKKQSNQSNRILIITILVLILISYLLLKEYFPTIQEYLE